MVFTFKLEETFLKAGIDILNGVMLVVLHCGRHSPHHVEVVGK